MPRRVAYLMSRFPHVPETFILREMDELAQLGWDVVPYPLIRQRQEVVHRAAVPWIARVRHGPFLSLAGLTANLRELARHPARYLAVWRRVLRDNLRSRRFLLRAVVLLPKAVHYAERMRQDRVRHIHAHYATHPALVAWVVHRLTGIPYSVTVHAHDIFVEHAMLDTKLREASFVVAISEFNRRFLSRSLGTWVESTVEVIHCGIDPASYRPRREARRREEALEILSIGSLQPYKGLEHLVEACGRLKQRGLRFRCRIIGEGGERRRLERLVRERALEGMLELLGAMPQEAVAELLPDADCYVQPSVVTASGKMEGIPVALMEALACEVPAIASSISGIPELVRHGETGQLVAPGDGEALAGAISWVHDNPERARAQARAGRELVLREFQLRTNVGRLAALLEREIPAGAKGPIPAPQGDERVAPGLCASGAARG